MVERPKHKNAIYLPVLAVGALTAGLILTNAAEKQDASRSHVPLNFPNLEASLLAIPSEPTTGLASKQYQNFERLMKSLSTDPDLKIDIENGIPANWPVYSAENWYARLIHVTEGDMNEYRVALNNRKLGRDFSREEYELARGQLRQAILEYQVLQAPSHTK